MFLLLAQSGYSQSSAFITRHYTSENGLPQNSVKNILFDRNGYCWIATESGLVRFDNREFKVFGLDNIQGLADDRIQAMSRDLAGNVFAKNLGRQTISTNPIDHLNTPTGQLSKKNDPNYYPTYGYLSSNEWIGKLWDSLQNRASVPLIRKHAYLKNGDTYLVFKDDIYWITNNGYRLLKRWATAPIANAPIGSDGFIQLLEGGKLAVWKKGRLTQTEQLSGDIQNNAAYRKGNCHLLWCPTGTFIFAEKRLYQLTIENNRIYSKEVLSSLPISAPSCIYYTPANNTYYIGTLTNGLFVFKLSDFTIPEIPLASGTPNFYGIAKTTDDYLIVKNTVIPPDRPAYTISIQNNFFKTAYTDQAGNMYYDMNYQLGSFNVHSGTTKNLLPLDEKPVSILPVTGEASLFVCTYKSLYFVSKTGQQFWKHELPLPYDSVWATGFYPLSGDNFMLLTNKGAKWYDLKTNRIKKSILDSISFRSFYKDKEGRIWLGSDGAGVFMYQNEQIYKLPFTDFKASKTVHSFIDDGRGFFWLPTNNGLYRINIRQLTDYITHQNERLYIYMLNNRDGLLTNEFNGGSNPAYQWLGDSTLVLPSLKGLVKFQPFKLKINDPDDPIFLDGVEVDNTPIRLTRGGDVTHLNPDFELLSIKVSCPYFGNPENLQLEYAIQNNDLETQWLRVPPSGLLTINRLPAGDYQIAFRKAGYQTKSRSHDIVLKISVSPHFYNTWWFYSVMLLIFAVAGYIFSRRRIIYLEKKNIKIEQLVADRTAQLHLVAKQLTKSEQALRESNQVKEQVIAIVLHDLRSPIRFLGTISNNLVKNFKEENPIRFYENLKKLNKSVGILRGFIDQFFSWAVIQQDAFQVKNVAFPLQDLFQETADFYAEILSYNGNQLLVMPTKIDCNMDRDMLSLILRNLVDNANKHTENGIITIEGCLVDTVIHITVSDNGIGLNEDQVKMFTDDRKDVMEQGTGSFLIRTMLRRLGGSLRIQTTLGKGSSFLIIVPQSTD